MQSRIPRDDRPVPQHVGLPLERRDHAPRLPDQHDPGRDVPRRQHELPEGVEAPRGDVGEVERRGARAPDTARAAHHGGELVQISPQGGRSEEHTSELQSPCNLVCRLLLEKKKKYTHSQLPRKYASCAPMTSQTSAEHCCPSETTRLPRRFL